MKYSMTNWKNN